MISPSLRPYPCRLKALPGAPIYEFDTDGGLTYFIAFRHYNFPSPVLTRHGLVFDLELKSPGVDPGTDRRIEATVLAILQQVLRRDPQTVILWVCSAADQRAAARNRKFDRWYRDYVKKNGLTLIKKDSDPALDQYVSLLYRADYPDRAAIDQIPLDDQDKL